AWSETPRASRRTAESLVPREGSLSKASTSRRQVSNMRKARQGNTEYPPPMNRLVLYFLSLAAITGLAVGIVLLRIRVDPLPLAAVLGALALVLSAFAGLGYPGLTRQLRHWATASAWAAFGMPFLLLVPYFLFMLGTHTFSPVAAAKLAPCVLVPTALLLP